MKVLLEEKRKIILALLMGAALLFFAVIMYNTYDAYTNMVVEQQQQHLLLISRAVAQNMELYISDQLRDIRSVTQTPGFLESMEYYYTVGETARMKEYIFSYMQSHQQDPVRIYVLDRYGQEIFHYNQYPFSGELDEDALVRKEAGERDRNGVPYRRRALRYDVGHQCLRRKRLSGHRDQRHGPGCALQAVCGQLKFPGSGRYCGEGWEREYYHAPGFPDAAIQF